jgi:hypothetical protein
MLISGTHGSARCVTCLAATIMIETHLRFPKNDAAT